MFSDIRLALRHLAAAKGFTITALVTLALGIGVNAGIFTLVHGIMLKSLPVADPERIVRVGDGDNCCVLGGLQGRFSIYSYPLYRYLRAGTPEFEDMSAFQGGIGKVGIRRAGSNTSEPYVDQFVSGNYFSLFGLRAFAGRLIAPADDVRGAPPVAVLSYRAWQQNFGADPSLVGAGFIVDGMPVTVIGIAPPGFFGAAVQPDPPDFWLPLASEPVAHGENALLDRKDAHWLYVFGRAKPGMPVSRVEAEVNTELRQWLMANVPPAAEKDRREIEKQHITLAPGGAGLSEMKENFQHDLRLLMGITALVLLIACANLANLQLARGAAAAAQTSIRVALGAPRSRLIRQSLIESTVLAVAGGALGLLVAAQTAALLIRLAFHGAHFVPIDVAPSLPVLTFSFCLSVVTGVAFGLAPAWSASRANPALVLQSAGRGAGGRSLLPQRVLVVLQAALSLMLLAGAGLLAQTLRNLTAQQFGFQMDGALSVNVHAGFAGYSPEKLTAIYNGIDRQVRQIAGVHNVALALYGPMSGDNWQSGATLEDRPQSRISPSWDRVSGSFFDTIGAHILRGRTFNERDTPDRPQVAVVNQDFVDTYFPNDDPIGKRFGLGGMEHRADFQIVGVVNTIRFRNPRGSSRPMFFLSILQWKDTWDRSNLAKSILLRVSGKPPDLAARLKQILGAIDPNLTMLNVTPVSEQLGRLLAHEQLIGTLAQVFGGLALVLASIGLYGVTAYSVARRTGEIGVRTALGATRPQIVRLVLQGALAQAGMGIALGIPAALAAGRLLSGELYGVKTSDPVILLSAALILAVCAALAGLIPAARAASVDPIQALRVEN